MKERPTQAVMFSKTQAAITKNAVARELEADTFLDLLFVEIEKAADAELTFYTHHSQNIPKLALDKLQSLEYTVKKNDNGYLISWDKPAMVNQGISIPEFCDKYEPGSWNRL